MADQEGMRITVAPPAPGEDTTAIYSDLVTKREAANLDDWFNELVAEEPATPGSPNQAERAQKGSPTLESLGVGEDDASKPQASPAAAPASPVAKSGATPGDGGDGWTLGDVAPALLAIGKDVGKGSTEIVPQALGGVLGAIDEAAKLADQIIPLGSIQLTNEAGEFDLDWLSQEQTDGDAIFNALMPDEAESLTGGVVRSGAQFLAGFIPALKLVKGAAVLKGAPLLSEMAAGAIADAVVFDPHEDRLSTFLNQVPALDAVVPDYLADNNPANESSWEGRIKNAVEGAGLGLATELFLRTFKYYKAQRQAGDAATIAADPIGAQQQAARDQLKAAARDDLEVDIPDEALAPLGAPDAPLLIEAKPDETIVQATDRLKAATARAELSATNQDALGKINEVVARFSSKRPPETGRDSMDDMLDELRSGAVSSAKLPKRPVAAIVRALGGVDPTSSFAGDLRSRGITAKSFPGLFRKGGHQTLDNIPTNEHPIFSERNADDGAGYIPQQSFIEGLEAELKGEPWRLTEEQRLFDDVIGPIDELDAELSKLGIEYENMSNEAIKARIKQIGDEEAAFKAIEETPPNMGDDALSDRDAAIEEMRAVIQGDLPPKGTPLSELSAALKTRTAAIDEMVRLLAEDGGSVRLRHQPKGAEPDGRTALVGPDMSEPGKFRITRFDERGPVGHTVHNTREEAIEGALRENYMPAPRTIENPKAPLVDETKAPIGVQGKVFINHARINSADDVKATLQAMADMDEAAIKDKTRGVVSNQQTIRESAKEYKDLNDLLGREPGPMTAAKAVAARRLLVSSGEQIVQLAQKAQSPEATPADLYNFRRAMAVHYAIQSEVIAARTETARALQSWAIPAGATKARTQAISNLIAQGGGAGDLQALAKAVSTVGNNPTALNAMASELGRGKFGKALYQVWINGLLSSPKTHAVNILSNAMVAMYAIPERYVAAQFSNAFYNGEIAAGEAAAQVFGMVKGIRDGSRLAVAGSKVEGVGGLSDIFDAFGKIDTENVNAISAEAFGLSPSGGFGWGIDMLGKAVNVPGSMLGAEDKFFKSIGYRMELQAQAYRAAAAEGLEGREFAARVQELISNPPEQLKADAIDTAHYQTFTAPLGKMGQATQLLLSRVPGARIVVPFVRTPTNIMKYTFARTPLAYMSGKIRADIAAGGARAAQAHARVAMGSMLMLTMIDMAAEGTVEGRGPLDPKVRKAWLDAGHMPYSVKIGDRRYTYNRLDPVGMMMGLGADMAEIFSNANEEDAGMLATAGVLALANNLASKTYMSGIYDFIAAVDPSNPTSNPAKYLENFAGSLVPYSSFLRNTAQAVDPMLRDARTAILDPKTAKLDPVATWLDNMQNRIRKGIPGMSDELPAMQTLWGEDVTTASGIGWAYDFISPIASKADDPDPVDQVILDNKIAISAAPRIINGVRLSGQEYADFVREAGRPAKEYLDQLIASPGFKRMSDGPDGMKAEIVKDVINNFRDRAKAVMMQKNPLLRERSFLVEQSKRKLLTGN